MSTAAFYLIFGGLVTLGFGVAYLARTDRMARMVGIELRTPGARADYRSIYGGAQVALGVYFLAAANRPEWHQAGLLGLALFAAGFGVARLGTLALEREGRNPQWVVGVLEILAALAALWIIWS